jgi:hypothetical protein
MINHAIEKMFMYRGYECVIVIQRMGQKIFANCPYEAKSLKFCVAECESIIDQIEEMRDNL